MPTGQYKREPWMYANRKPVSKETRQKLSEIAQAHGKDPEWRKRVSEGTKKRMQDPEVRVKHLAGLYNAFAKTENGNNFTGGQGQQRNALQQIYADIFLPLGYVEDHPVQWGERGERYRLDFALVEEKICIEIDGSSHKGKEEHDELKDATLKAFGWKVIRINHVND